MNAIYAISLVSMAVYLDVVTQDCMGKARSSGLSTYLTLGLLSQQAAGRGKPRMPTPNSLSSFWYLNLKSRLLEGLLTQCVQIPKLEKHHNCHFPTLSFPLSCNIMVL